MTDFLLDLFDYNHFLNQQTAQLFQDHKEVLPEKAYVDFCHALNAHHIWNHRLSGSTPLYGVWETHPVAVLAKLDKNNYSQTCELLKNLDPEKPVNYTTSSGARFASKAKDILFHVVNHSTYHRAQIASELKKAGIAPLSSDYIFYKRSQSDKQKRTCLYPQPQIAQHIVSSQKAQAIRVIACFHFRHLPNLRLRKSRQ